MQVEMNINEVVLAKLTEKGIKRLKEKHKKRNTYLGLNEPFYLQRDENGYTAFQLWEFMQTFGDLLATNKDMPFEATVIFPQAKSN